MKSIKKISIMAIGTALMLGGTVFASTGTVTTNGLRMRKEASTESDIVTSLNNGAQVEIIEKVGDWYKVKYYDEYEGYLFGEYVKVEGEETTETEEPAIEENEPEQKPEEETTEEEPVQSEETTEEPEIPETVAYPMETTTKTNARIYMLPLITSTNIDEIKKDVEVTVEKELNDWVYISSETVSGWVRKYNINILEGETVETKPDEPETKPEEQTPVEEEEHETQEQVEEEPEQTMDEQEAAISKGYINVSAARIREKPSTSSDILEVLTLNTEVKITAQTDEWYKIEFNEIIGYISKTLISETATQTSRGNSTRQPEVQTIPVEEENKVAEEVENTPEVQEDVEQTPVEEPVEEKIQVEEQNYTAGQKVIEFAKQYLGYRYVYGGTTPSGGFDCSGFTYYVYNACGHSLSRSCSVQARSGRAVSKAELQEGDLVFFDNTSDGSIGHVGIYVGNGNFIHAANPNRGVVIDTLESGYYYTYYYSARRIF